MSQIHYQLLSLEEMVKHSSCIVVATKNDPFITSENIDITRGIKFAEKDTPPPYRKLTRSFEVLEILKGKNNIKKGPVLVTEAHLDASLKIHTSWHLDGMSRSPSYQAYNSGIDISDLDQAIIFLNHYEGFHFAFDFSWESTDRKKEIKKMIRATKEKGIFTRLS